MAWAVRRKFVKGSGATTFAPPPKPQSEKVAVAPAAAPPEDSAPDAKRQRLEPDEVSAGPASAAPALDAAAAQGSAPAAAPAVSGGGLSSEQRMRIDQNRLAALERKQQKQLELGSQDPSCSQAIAELRANIEKHRLAALAQKEETAPCIQEINADQQARIQQNRLAALARKQQKEAEGCQPSQSSSQQETTPITRKKALADAAASTEKKVAGNKLASSTAVKKGEADDTSSSPPTPTLSSCSSPCEDMSDAEGDGVDISRFCDDFSDVSSRGSASARSGTSSSPSDSASNSSSSSGSSSNSASESHSSSSSSESEAEDDSMPAQDEPVLPGSAVEAQSVEEDSVQKALPSTEAPSSQAAPETQAPPEDDKNAVPEPKPAEERDAKQKLVAQLLCRWWFAFTWPPEDFDSDAVLLGRGFRRAPLNTFDMEPELDERGLRKAYELEQFPGCFRNNDGELLDVRPTEGRPCYQQMMLKTTPELYRLLLAAYEGQMEELVAETKKEGASTDLAGHLETLRKQTAQVRQKAMFFMSFKPKEEPAKKGA